MMNHTEVTVIIPPWVAESEAAVIAEVSTLWLVRRPALSRSLRGGFRLSRIDPCDLEAVAAVVARHRDGVRIHRDVNEVEWY